MPTTICAVPECDETGDHIIPSNKERRKQWIHAIRRGENRFKQWTPSKYSYVCRNHFCNDDYVSLTYHGTPATCRRLKKTAVPSIFPWIPKPSPDNRARKDRQTRRQLLRDLTNVSNSQEDYEEPSVSESEPMDTDIHAEICDDQNIANFEVIRDDSSANDEITNAEESDDPVASVQLTESCSQTPKQPPYGFEEFMNDDVGIHYYTGLESVVKFLFVLSTLGPAAHCLRYVHHNVVNISVVDQFFMVLRKLRRHTPNFELARMFRVSEKSVSNIVYTWIIFMYKQWKELEIWPPKELVHYFSPSGFESQYPNTRVIVDGTECPVKKPSNPKYQQATFSTYKNRNTVKSLIGATPGGLISYVSEVFAGSTSDRQIVERSNLVNMCDTKDSIMADKGFNVQDLFAPQDVTVNIPTFFKKKNRMSGETVMRDRKIASKRVHIERIIGLMKTYKVLVEPITATETKMSSEIIFICAMLCNFRNCIVPKDA